MALGTPYELSTISPAPRAYKAMESWRAEQGISRAELCRRIGMKTQYYSTFPKRPNMLTKNAIKIAKTLGIDPLRMVAFIDEQGQMVDANGNRIAGENRLAPASAVSHLLEKTFTQKQLYSIYHNSDTVKELLKVLEEKSA